MPVGKWTTTLPVGRTNFLIRCGVTRFQYEPIHTELQEAGGDDVIHYILLPAHGADEGEERQGQRG